MRMGSAPGLPDEAQTSSEIIVRSTHDHRSSTEIEQDDIFPPSPRGKTLTPSGRSRSPLRRTESACRRQRILWQGIVLGQLLSALVALISMSAASLDDRGVNLPSFVNLINYTLLTVAFLGPMVVTRRSLNLPWWRYALYALVSLRWGEAGAGVPLDVASCRARTLLDSITRCLVCTKFHAGQIKDEGNSF